MLCCDRKPLCNGRQHTAPNAFGFTFPLCWRCSSIAATVGIMQITLGTTMSLHWGFGIFGAVLVVLSGYDGYKSYFTRSGTTNLNRAFFGSLAGVGLFLISMAIPGIPTWG